MRSASSTQAASAAASGAGGSWLYGPSVDWLFGAGAGYLLSIPLLLLWSGTTGIGAWPIAAGAVFALLISGPHYGATILRVYEQRRDRRKYAFFALWATLGLCVLFVVGLHQVWVGSLLVTLYATWSPWHFSGQNYGLALMFLRRRGVPVDDPAKRLLYASFLLSCALALLRLHAQVSVVSAASVPVSEGSLFRFLSLGLSQDFVAVAVPLVAAAYLASLVGAFTRLGRGGRWRDLGPAASLVLVQSLWFALPSALRVLGEVPLEGLAFSVIWVSAVHAAQYLWVTSYYARREDPQHRLGPYLGRALLAGSTVTVFPALLFAPGLLGTVPWDVGLAILLFSVVNLHHFVLDGAIWKLRDGRVAQLLLRDAPLTSSPAEAPRSWFRPAVAVLGAVSLVVALLDVWEREFVIKGADDVATLQRASERLAWIGRDTPPLHTYVAQTLAARGELEPAIAEYERSLALHPTPEAWIGLGQVHAHEGRWQPAADAFAAALRLSPDDVKALVFAGRSWQELGRPERAVVALERANTLAPNDASIAAALERASHAKEAR